MWHMVRIARQLLSGPAGEVALTRQHHKLLRTGHCFTPKTHLYNVQAARHVRITTGAYCSPRRASHCDDAGRRSSWR